MRKPSFFPTISEAPNGVLRPGAQLGNCKSVVQEWAPNGSNQLSCADEHGRSHGGKRWSSSRQLAPTPTCATWAPILWSSKLSSHLIGAIRRQLPVIQQHISEGIISLEKELESLGGPGGSLQGIHDPLGAPALPHLRGCLRQGRLRSTSNFRKPQAVMACQSKARL